MKKYYPIMIFLFFAGLALAEDKVECTYFINNGQDLVAEHDCLFYSQDARSKSTGGDARISKKVLTTATYDENGLGHLYSPAGIFYFTKSGLARKTLNYDNGPDYFSNGVARTAWKGKIGFFDKNLSIVIKPQYDFAYPFENGISVVCMGCVQKKAGEHTEMVGGKWGAINTKGQIVQPIVYSKTGLQTRINHNKGQQNTTPNKE